MYSAPQQRVRVDLDDGSTTPPPAVSTAAQATPVSATNVSARSVVQTRNRRMGCVPGLIKILFSLIIVIVLTIAVMGLMGFRIPVANEIAKTIGYIVVTSLTPNSMARLGYAVTVLPLVLIAATWITARAWK